MLLKKKLAEHFDISDATICKTFKKLEEYKDIIFDNNKTNEYVKNAKDTEKDNNNDEISNELKLMMEEYGIPQ